MTSCQFQETACGSIKPASKPTGITPNTYDAADAIAGGIFELSEYFRCTRIQAMFASIEKLIASCQGICGQYSLFRSTLGNTRQDIQNQYEREQHCKAAHDARDSSPGLRIDTICQGRWHQEYQIADDQRLDSL